jgi:predicted O-methyltransferase YrrM
MSRVIEVLKLRRDAKIKLKKAGLGAFCRSVALYIYHEFATYLSVLRMRLCNFRNVKEVVNFAFKFRLLGVNIRPLQVYEEILRLARIVHELRPRNVLEVGTASGGTLFIWARVSPRDTNIITVDLPGGYHKRRIPLYKSFAWGKQKMHLIMADSHDPNTLYTLKKILRGEKLDFLFIDGDHTYEGVKKDFDMYSLLVKKGGVIAFHDIVEHPPESGCDVSRFWNEIKKNYESSEEIIKDRKQGWAGIGVIYV